MQDKKPYFLKIREARIVKGLTQGQAAKLVGINRVNYNRIEKGKALPSKKTLDALCNKLDICLQLL